MARVYLDHNATTPLRAEAKAAMLSAMDVVGNPSSVHAEGRAAKMMIERARAQVAALVGCLPTQVVFTGSATEAAALAVAQKDRHGGVFAALPTEHDCLLAWNETAVLPLAQLGGGSAMQSISAIVGWAAQQVEPIDNERVCLLAISAANSETGIMTSDKTVVGSGLDSDPTGSEHHYSTLCDITQMAGKAPVTYADETPSYAILSAHKLGGPKGVGALINFTADDPTAMLKGGGQEMGRRSGTENVIGIAGFGAAAEAANADVTQGRWDQVAELRDLLEDTLAAASNSTIFVGKDLNRLPNTTCMITPGWKGETQVMQMDLAGFAISAGSACSSGKVKASTVLKAMGFDDLEASSAIRVSLGLDTTRDEVLAFASAWTEKLKKHMQRAA